MKVVLSTIKRQKLSMVYPSMKYFFFNLTISLLFASVTPLTYKGSNCPITTVITKKSRKSDKFPLLTDRIFEKHKTPQHLRKHPISQQDTPKVCPNAAFLARVQASIWDMWCLLTEESSPSDPPFGLMKGYGYNVGGV